MKKILKNISILIVLINLSSCNENDFNREELTYVYETDSLGVKTTNSPTILSKTFYKENLVYKTFDFFEGDTTRYLLKKFDNNRLISSFNSMDSSLTKLVYDKNELIKIIIVSDLNEVVIDNIHYKKDNKDSIILKSNGKILGYIVKSFDANNNKEKSVLTYELRNNEYILKEEKSIEYLKNAKKEILLYNNDRFNEKIETYFDKDEKMIWQKKYKNEILIESRKLINDKDYLVKILSDKNYYYKEETRYCF